jgi:hypothetical protein
MVKDTNTLNKIIGTRELQANLSSFLDSVISNGTEITTLNDVHVFNLVIEFDNETQQYSSGIDEIKIHTVSDRIENVKVDIVDLVIDATDDYFQNTDLYIKIPEYKKMYPYFLLIKHCKNNNEVINLINAN